MLNQIPLDLSPLSDPKFYQYDLDIVASCHGFICLYYGSQHGDIYLWNPTTTSLSSSGLKPLPPVTPREKFDVEPNSVGVVFDPISNDFKVLRLLNVMYNENFKAEVYTKVLVRGDCLKIVEGFPLSFCPDFWNTVYMGGFFFWWTIDAGVESIVAFDFSKEVFILMMLLDLSAYLCFSQLTVLNKSFCGAG